MDQQVINITEALIQKFFDFLHQCIVLCLTAVHTFGHRFL